MYPHNPFQSGANNRFSVANSGFPVQSGSNPVWNRFPFVKSGLEPLLHKTIFWGFWVGGFNFAKEMHMECRTSSEQLSY